RIWAPEVESRARSGEEARHNHAKLRRAGGRDSSGAERTVSAAASEPAICRPIGNLNETGQQPGTQLYTATRSDSSAAGCRFLCAPHYWGISGHIPHAEPTKRPIFNAKMSADQRQLKLFQRQLKLFSMTIETPVL